MTRLFWVLFVTLIITTALSAQEQTIVMPDLTGMNVPQAGAELNRIGLRLGSQTDASWSENQSIAEGSISQQSVSAGSAVEAGTAVDVVVLRAPNLRLYYDDNDLTVINLTDKTVDLTGLTFAADNQASFIAAQLTDNLRGYQCVQIWSVSRNGPKDLDQCNFIQNWLSTNDTNQHFWTSVSGVTAFNIVQDGTTRTTCNGAPANSQDQPVVCDFYLPSGGQGGDVAEYIYFIYTTEHLLVVNTAPDAWMRLNRATIYNANPNQQRLGSSFKIGDPALFGNPDIVADVKRLAPQQCVLFKRDDVGNDPLPQPCDVIVQLDLPADQLFWLYDFELESKSTQRYTCPAAVAGKRTVCAMPR